MKKALLLTGLAALSIGLVGCGDSGATSAPAPQQEQQNAAPYFDKITCHR